LKKTSRLLANSDSVCLRLSTAEICHDGSADGRSKPAVLCVQPRTAHSNGSFAAPDQSGGGAGTGIISSRITDDFISLRRVFTGIEDRSPQNALPTCVAGLNFTPLTKTDSRTAIPSVLAVVRLTTNSLSSVAVLSILSKS
jgi:hypothetical protein